MLDNPLVIAVGLLVSLGALGWAGHATHVLNDSADLPPSTVIAICAFGGVCGAVGLLGSLFFVTRFVKWAWSFAF